MAVLLAVVLRLALGPFAWSGDRDQNLMFPAIGPCRFRSHASPGLKTPRACPQVPIITPGPTMSELQATSHLIASPDKPVRCYSWFLIAPDHTYDLLQHHLLG